MTELFCLHQKYIIIFDMQHQKVHSYSLFRNMMLFYEHTNMCHPANAVNVM